MDIVTKSHRAGLEFFKTNGYYNKLWKEITDTLYSISERDIVNHFVRKPLGKRPKSISATINEVLQERLVTKGWRPRARIFCEGEYKTKFWQLDFAKEGKESKDGKGVSVECAFNNGGSIAWNLLKPTMASELSHVEKDIQTTAGVVITATNALQKVGGFDNAIGTFEDYVMYLRPLQSVLSVPLVIVGLEAVNTFHIQHVKVRGNTKTHGKVVKHANF